MGRSDIFLRLEIIKKIPAVIILVTSMWFGVTAITVGELVCLVLWSFVNAYPNKKLLNYGYFEQIKDILPSAALSAVMGAVVYCVNFLDFHPALTLCIQVPLGVVVYIAGARILRLESLEYFLSKIKNLFRRERK